MYVELQKRRNPTPKVDRAVRHYIFCNPSYVTVIGNS